jgi:ABC-2 type transport system permease protein
VMSRGRGAQPGGSAEAALPRPRNPLSVISGFVDKTLAMSEFEVRKIRHDPTEIIMRAVQPVIWLLVFGEVFTHFRAIPTGNVRYIDFLTPGVLAQSTLFIAIFSGITLIWERDLGIVHKFLVSPTSRGALALGKALSGGVRGLPQAVLIFILAVILKVDINWNPMALLGVLAAVLIGATAFTSLSMIVAFLVKTRERFMGIGQVLTMPLFFASSAIYPISVMPRWLQVIAHVNPLTYQVDALRRLMLVHGVSTYNLGLDFGVLIFTTVVLVTIAARLYPNIVK